MTLWCSIFLLTAAFTTLRARTAALSSGMAEFTTATTGRAVGSALASWTWLPEVNSTMEEARRLLRERAAVDETEFVDTRGRRRRKKKKEEVEPVREDSPATKERKYQQRVQKEAKTWIEIQMKRFTKDDED